MLSFSILIGASYVLWFIASLVTIVLLDEDAITIESDMIIDNTARFVRLLLQQLAFMWILTSFQTYSGNVSKSIERKRRKSSMRTKKKAPEVKIDKLDSV